MTAFSSQPEDLRNPGKNGKPQEGLEPVKSNPNPRANENIKDKESQSPHETESGKGAGTEITDGEDG